MLVASPCPLLRGCASSRMDAISLPNTKRPPTSYRALSQEVAETLRKSFTPCLQQHNITSDLVDPVDSQTLTCARRDPKESRDLGIPKVHHTVIEQSKARVPPARRAEPTSGHSGMLWPQSFINLDARGWPSRTVRDLTPAVRGTTRHGPFAALPLAERKITTVTKLPCTLHPTACQTPHPCETPAESAEVSPCRPHQQRRSSSWSWLG